MMKILKKIWHGESGMAVLGLVLILMVVGGLMVPALLFFVSTGLHTGQIIESKTLEYYSANSGIDAALWRIKIDDKLDWLSATEWGESIYAHSPEYESYTLSSGDPINDRSVVYQIGPKWVLAEIETPNGTQKRDCAPNLTVACNYMGTLANNNGSYKIVLIYDGTVGQFNVQRIGCWLPAGFRYVNNSSNLEQSGQPYNCVPQIVDYKGGKLITWNFSQTVSYDQLPSDISSATRKAVTFQFTHTVQSPPPAPQGHFSWIRTSNTANYLAWNTDLKLFEVKSTATSPSGESTTATAITTKTEFQNFGAVMEGDYFAIGNTLMRDTNDSDQLNKDRLYKESPYTISAIPANANVAKIFLYWTGWKCKPWNAWNYSNTTCQTWPATYNVNKVALKIVDTASGVQYTAPSPNYVTASATQVLPNGTSSADHGWSYSCYADITNQVKTYFHDQGVSFVGNGTYTVGHWDTGNYSTSSGRIYRLYTWNPTALYPYSGESVATYTKYPLGSPRDGGKQDSTENGRNEEYAWGPPGTQDEWANAAWSIIIVYTSPSTRGHQFYLFDTLRYAQNTTLNFTISGFLTPDLTDEADAAKLTCFVGEGDSAYTGDSIAVNGTTLSGDADNPSNNVWNSQSRIAGSLLKGIDIDTFNISKTIIRPGDNQASIALHTDTDAWNLVYMILSFRSKLTTGGVMIYYLQ